jgi:hypothetical protein
MGYPGLIDLPVDEKKKKIMKLSSDFYLRIIHI